MINSFYSAHLNGAGPVVHSGPSRFNVKFPVPFCITATCFALSEIPAIATWRHSQADSSQLTKAHLMDFVISCIKKNKQNKDYFFLPSLQVLCKRHLLTTVGLLVCDACVVLWVCELYTLKVPNG